MIAITWSISSLDYAVSEFDMDNVVVRAHWRCTGKDDNGNTGAARGVQRLPAPTSEGFIAWEEVTQEIALQWLKDSAEPGKRKKVEAEVTAQISEKVNPTHGSGLPW